jgi:hypothetical protein
MQTPLRRLPLLLLPLVLAACASMQPAPQELGGEREEEVTPGMRVMVVGDLPNLIFSGVTRKTAKLTMVTATTVTYSSITAVTSLTAPAVNSTSPRTGVEDNLATFTAYLYAYNLPADNDFHLILGDTSTFQSGVTNLINVEVSGRPDNTDTVFKAVRTQFLGKIGNPTTMSHGTYVCIATPIAVTVSGGPFWDTSHPSGGSGTGTCYNGVQMKTINGWELHPVNSIN